MRLRHRCTRPNASATTGPFRGVDDLELATLWKRRRDRPERGAGTEDSSVPMVETVMVDVPQRHAVGVQADDHLIETAESARPFGHQPLGDGCAGCRMRSSRSGLRTTCGSRKSTSTPTRPRCSRPRRCRPTKGDRPAPRRIALTHKQPTVAWTHAPPHPRAHLRS
jgi:hypothetical protein